MAHKKSLLASSGLEALHVPLTPTLSPSVAPEGSVRQEEVLGSDLLKDFPSLRPKTARKRLESFPLRLYRNQIDALLEMQQNKGIVAAEFIRDAIDHALGQVI